MNSSIKLAMALREIGLEDMAKKAEDHEYNDFLSPHDLPIIHLINDLAKEIERHPDLKGPIQILQRRATDGAFDASKEESDAWAKSKEGMAARAKFGKFSRR